MSIQKNGVGNDDGAPPDSFEIVDGVRVSINRDGGAILDINRGRMFSLNATGARIMLLLRDKLTVEDIVMTVSKEFERPTDSVRADVERFVSSLRSLELVD